MQDQDSRAPAQENRAIVIDDLVKLIEGMDPFLDCSGRAFCSMPHSDPAKRGKLPLRDRQVRSVLSFRYWEEHQTYPGRERVNEAIEYFEGKLLANRTGPIVSTDCPILRCFLLAIEEEDWGTGSADDILKMLRTVNERNRQKLKGKVTLPKSPTAMGKWLVKNQLLLQAHGIEVFRPPRGSKKRLWDWRKIIRDDDTSDTSHAEVSPDASLPKAAKTNDIRLNDTLTEEDYRILQEAQS